MKKNLGLTIQNSSDKGFSLVEMMIAGSIGFAVLTTGFALYRMQTKTHLSQNDASEEQMTVDYVISTIRTLTVSAGGGLPQLVTGIRNHANGKGITVYTNPEDASTAVVLDSNADTTDGYIPVTDITLFMDAGFVLLTNDDTASLAEIQSVDYYRDRLLITNPLIEKGMGYVSQAYPVQYCSLYVDGTGNLRRTYLAQGAEFKKVPLAQNIDSLDVRFDLSLDGNGTFVKNVTDISKISRVKVYLRVRPSHSILGSKKRNFETIFGIRRGRLYNRAT